jgi:hypothetical protein
MQADIAKARVAELGDGTFPHIGIQAIVAGSRRWTGEIGLAAVVQRRGARQFGGGAVDIHMTRLDLDAGAVDDAQRAMARRAADAAGTVADDILERVAETPLEYVHQLVPVGIGEHASLLLIDTGVVFIRLQTVPGNFGFHDDPPLLEFFISGGRPSRRRSTMSTGSMPTGRNSSSLSCIASNLRL